MDGHAGDFEDFGDTLLFDSHRQRGKAEGIVIGRIDRNAERRRSSREFCTLDSSESCMMCGISRLRRCLSIVS